ncbi:NAD(P)/FAD-dependent oxidoreductase [Arthrobacter koreensis]|uniref:NAD(P)/FAD-dependent oxidoreductase n=1 Tax=Arthrobacter koreensis TaxID=199136 RepID=UPI0036DA1FEC
MSQPRSAAIIGAGPAGFSAAAELRRRGFPGRIQLLDPDGLPYDRPPLSKAYLAGGSATALAEDSWYQANAVEVVSGMAVQLHPDSGTVVLAGGEEIQADAVLLATGGTARTLPVPGAELLHTLRTRADADALRGRLGAGKRLAIIGAGLIGAEVAATAAAAGTAVVLIDPVPVPLVPAMGPEAAAYLHSLHARNGVETLTALPVDAVPDGAGLAVLLEDGSAVAADTVLAAVGMVPDTALAEAAGLEVDDGIVVDSAGRTSHPRVYAAGDAVRLRSGGHLERRAEHWDAAARSGQAAAAGILGQEPPEAAVPWFWTDRYGIHAEAVGSMTRSGSSVERGLPGPGYMVFRVSEDGTLAGAAGIDAGNSMRAARRLIALGKPVDAAALADPKVDLRRLLRPRP